MTAFKVFYRRKGKLLWDTIKAPSADEAGRKLLAFAKELRWTVELVRVEEVKR